MAGVLTRAELEKEALDNIAKSGVLTLQSGTTLATRMTTWVNRAQLWIARRADILQKTYTASTVTSQQTYVLPSVLRRLYTIRLVDGLNSRKLTCVLPWEMDRKLPYPPAQTTGISVFYVPYSDSFTFELYPIPDAAYTLILRAGIYPTDFASSIAVSQYTYCDDAIIAYATMMAFRWLQELKDASVWEKHGNDIIDSVAENFDESSMYPDWAPTSEGFSIQGDGFIGDPQNNPFIRDNNLNTWWR